MASDERNSGLSDEEEQDEEAEERWADESPASDPSPELTHERDPDDSPEQPNDEA